MSLASEALYEWLRTIKFFPVDSDEEETRHLFNVLEGNLSGKSDFVNRILGIRILLDLSTKQCLYMNHSTSNRTKTGEI